MELMDSQGKTSLDYLKLFLDERIPILAIKKHYFGVSQYLLKIHFEYCSCYILGKRDLKPTMIVYPSQGIQWLCLFYSIVKIILSFIINEGDKSDFIRFLA